MNEPPRRHTVLFDADCPICLRSVEALKRKDKRRVLAFRSIRHPETPKLFPSLSPEALEQSIHLVSPDGKVREGAEAVEALLALLPGLSWTGLLFRLPFARPLARWLYRLVARNRYLLTCRRHCG